MRPATRLLALLCAVAALATVAPGASAYTTVSSPLAFAPSALALRPSADEALVVGTGTSIARYSTPDLVAGTPINGSLNGTAVAFRADGRWAFAGFSGGVNVGIIDPLTTPWGYGSAGVGAAQTGLAANAANGRVYVAVDTAGTGGAIKSYLADNSFGTEPTKSLTFDPQAVVVAPDGSSVYVTGASTSKIAQWDLTSGTLTERTITVVSQDFAIDPTGTFAYVPGQFGASDYRVLKVRLADFAVVGTLSLANDANPGGVDLCEGDGLLYIAQRGSGIAVVDPATMTLAATIPTSLRAANDVEADVDGQYLYAALGSPQNGIARIQLRPSAPTDLRATAGDRSATIAFTAGSDNGAAIANYEYTLDGGATWTALSPAQASSPVTVGGLVNGTAYSIGLRALNGQAPGQPSAAVAVTPTPTPTTAGASGTANASGTSGGTLRLSRAKVSRKAITTSFTATASGSATITGILTTTGRAAAVAVCTGRSTVRKAGTVRLTCVFTKRAKALRAKGALRVSLAATFRSSAGLVFNGKQSVRVSRS